MIIVSTPQLMLRI